MTKLECTHCRCTIDVKVWNKANTGAELIGTMLSDIPEDITPEKWYEWRQGNGGRLDCPECGEVSSTDDMDAF